LTCCCIGGLVAGISAESCVWACAVSSNSLPALPREYLSSSRAAQACGIDVSYYGQLTGCLHLSSCNIPIDNNNYGA